MMWNETTFFDIIRWNRSVSYWYHVILHYVALVVIEPEFFDFKD